MAVFIVLAFLLAFSLIITGILLMARAADRRWPGESLEPTPDAPRPFPSARPARAAAPDDDPVFLQQLDRRLGPG